jgi:hypothetical protein
MITTLFVLGMLGDPVGASRRSHTWVLWQKAGGPAGAWEVLNSYESRERCRDKLKKYAKKLAGPTEMIDIDDNRGTISDVSGLNISRTLLCLPDRLYPSLPPQ